MFTLFSVIFTFDLLGHVGNVKVDKNTISTYSNSLADIRVGSYSYIVLKANTTLRIKEDRDGLYLYLIKGSITLSSKYPPYTRIIAKGYTFVGRDVKASFSLSSSVITLINVGSPLALDYKHRVRILYSDLKFIITDEKLSSSKLASSDKWLLAELQNIQVPNVVTSPLDVVVVIDTSMSMLEKMENGIRVFNALKSALRDFIFSLQRGDRITLVTFDARPKLILSRVIRSRLDIYHVYNVLLSLKALGKSTSLTRLLFFLHNLTKRLLNDKLAKKVLVYIFSDGKDDPPKNAKRFEESLVNLVNLYSKLKGVKLYFMDLNYSKKVAREVSSKYDKYFRKLFMLVPIKNMRIKRHLARIIFRSNIPVSNPKEVKTYTRKLTFTEYILTYVDYRYLIPMLMAVFSVKFLSILYSEWSSRKRKRSKGMKKIVYYKRTSPQRKFTFNFRWGVKKEITISGSYSADIYLPELNSTSVVIYYSEWQGQGGYAISNISLTDVTFIKKSKKSVFLVSGDTFKVGDWIFKYV